MVQIQCGRGDGVPVTIINNGKRLVANFLPTNSLDNTIEGPLPKRYDAACLDNDDDAEENAAQQDIEDLILHVGQPIFFQLAPTIAVEAQLQNLHDLLYPETFYLRFVTINGKSKILQEQDAEAQRHYLVPPIRFINTD